MLDINFLLTFPHCGTHSLIEKLDPISYKAITNMYIEDFSKEKINKLDTNYIMLESITFDLRQFFGLADKNKKNIIYGHFLSHNNSVDTSQHINNMVYLSNIVRPIIALRDPLLQLCSIYTRDVLNVQEVVNRKQVGGKFSGFTYWARHTKYGRRSIYDDKNEEDKNKVHIAKEKEKTEIEIKFTGDSKPWLEKDISHWINREIPSGKRKVRLIKSDHIKCSHNQICNQLYMYEVLKYIEDFISPLYVPLDMERKDIFFEDYNFKYLPFNNTVKTTKHPIYEAYDSKDLLPIAYFLGDNLRELIRRQDIFMPIFRKQGYEDFWWLSKI